MLALTSLQIDDLDTALLADLVTRSPALRNLHIIDLDPSARYPTRWREDGPPAEAFSQLTTLTCRGEEYRRSQVDDRTLWYILPGAFSLEHLVTGLHAFVDEIFPNLVSCVNLRHLELVRSQNAPASDSGQSSYWSFRALAEQVARLVALDERTAEPLRIDVEVRGSLRKYDCAQRLAREAFAMALAEQPGRVEVWLWYYPGRPFKAFPL